MTPAYTLPTAIYNHQEREMATLATNLNLECLQLMGNQEGATTGERTVGQKP